MTSPAAISKESIKSLGPGAFLVTALPSIVLVISVFAMIASRLTPGVEPVTHNGARVDPGAASVMATVKSLGVAGGIALAITVLCVAVLLRPLQISLVQFLEGYWGTQGRRGYVKALADRKTFIRRCNGDTSILSFGAWMTVTSTALANAPRR